MRKSAFRFVAGAVILGVIGYAVRPTAADISPTSVAYLQASSQNAWTTMALVAAGNSHPPTDHLRTVSGTAATDYAKTILAVAAVGENPATFGNIDYVAALQGFFHGGQLGDENFLNDDAWGILALSAAGVPTSTAMIADAVAFLQNHQNTDGGFPFSVGGTSDTSSTAAAILALLEGGVQTSAIPLQRAFAYVQSTQNADGGFPYVGGEESDADSTAWVVWAIRKAGQDPASWDKNNGDPVTFLQSLINNDGSFAWKHSVPGANQFATQDAVLALADAVMPVGYYRAQTHSGQYHFRLEGRDQTVCDTQLDGQTAYDLLVAGSAACGYTYSGQTYEGLGFMLGQVNEDRTEGFSAWMYLVNGVPPSAGLQAYALQSGDSVVVYYDPDYRTPAYPDYDRLLQLSVSSSNLSDNQPVVATVTVFRDGQWQALAGATVRGGETDAVTGTDGTVTLRLAGGTYQLYAIHNDMVRSAKTSVTVGDGVASQVGLQAEIVTGGTGGPGGGSVAGSSISFSVSPAQLNFGKIQPGHQSAVSLQLNNDGSTGLSLTANVSGDSLFGNLALDGSTWQQYERALAVQQTASTTVTLAVPVGYLGRGVKTGELIFWAEAE